MLVLLGGERHPGRVRGGQDTKLKTMRPETEFVMDATEFVLIRALRSKGKRMDVAMSGIGAL